MSDSCNCPEHYPDWAGRDVDLAGRCVHTFPIASFFFMPLGFDISVERQRENIEGLELKETWPGLVLARTGMFKGSIMRFLEPNSSPGRFVSYLAKPFDVNVRLHEGGMGTVRQTVAAQQSDLLREAKMPKEIYLAHLTCPLCSERKGGEKILVFRRWLASAKLARRLGR